MGVYIAHTWEEIGNVFEFIDRFNVDRVVEIGTHKGGLSSLFIAKEEWDSEFRYLGIELNPFLLDERISKTNVLFGNCFDLHIRQSIKDFCSLGISLIYCDGGNKPLEFSTYLGVSDFIMVHDYGVEFVYEDYASFLDRVNEMPLLYKSTRVKAFGRID